MNSFELYDFKMKNHEQELKSLIALSKQINDENSELKDIMRNQNEQFTLSLKEMNTQMSSGHRELRESIANLKNWADQMVGDHGQVRM